MTRFHRERSPSKVQRDIHAPVQETNVNDSGSKTLAIIALVAACIALGAVCMYVILAGQIIESKIQAGAAKSEAVANQARVDARVSLDEVQRMRSRLEAKGIYTTDH